MNLTPPFGVPIIRASAGVDVATLLKRHGVDPQPVFERAGVPLEATQDPYRQLSLDRYTHLLELAADAAHCPNFGLTLGLQQDPAKWGAFGYLVLNSPTIGASLQNLATFLKPWQTGTHIDCFKSRGVFGIEYSIQHPKVVHKNQDAEVSMAYVKNLVDRLCERSVQPVAIHFEHHPIAEPSFYQKAFGISPSFEQPVNCISFPIALAEQPVRSADLQLFPVLRQHLVDMANAIPDGSDLAGAVIWHIRQLLPLRQCDLKAVARALAVEPRTLQRRLKKQGLVFADLVEQLRREQALDYLQNTTMEIKEISYLLGFSDTSALIKAFKKWTRLTPGEFRQQTKNKKEAPA